MVSPEYLFATAIAVVLLVLAGYFGWRQWLAVRNWQASYEGNLVEQRFHRAQTYRRFIGCGLMVVLAGLLLGSYWLGQENRASELARFRQAREENAQPRALNAEQQQFLNRYTWYWILFGLLFFAWVCLAFFDLLAIRRFGMRQLQQIQADRRAMIEQQVEKFRGQRNGHG